MTFDVTQIFKNDTKIADELISSAIFNITHLWCKMTHKKILKLVLKIE